MVLKQIAGQDKGNTKFVGKMHDWAKVAGELQGENLKTKIYDNALLDLIGKIEGKRILDYGGGPAVIASKMRENGADVHLYDIDNDMLTIAKQKLGQEKVHSNISEVLNGTFDILTCNLVVCIVPEAEVVRIARNIREALAPEGVAYIGFCNPKLYDVPESVIDFRHSTGQDYEENHEYMKTKKEGNYKIAELHRPIGWYKGIWDAVGLKLTGTFFTQEYVAPNGKKVNDFVIFQLKRGEMP